jgi:hypothetical protein
LLHSALSSLDSCLLNVKPEDGERLAYLYCNQTERSSDLENTTTILQSIVIQQTVGESNVCITDSVMQLYKRKGATGSLIEWGCVGTIVKLTNQYPLIKMLLMLLMNTKVLKFGIQLLYGCRRFSKIQTALSRFVYAVGTS